MKWIALVLQDYYLTSREKFTSARADITSYEMALRAVAESHHDSMEKARLEAMADRIHAAEAVLSEALLLTPEHVYGLTPGDSK